MRITLYILGSVILISFYMNCAPQHMTSTISGETQSSHFTDEQEMYIQGKALYGTHCAGCHGPLEGSTKKFTQEIRISDAIKTQPDMKKLQSLSAYEIKLVAQILNYDVPPDESIACNSAPDVGTVAMHRLNQYEYRKTVASTTGVILPIDLSFPTEEVAGFPNIAVNLRLTTAQAHWYLNTALSVVDNLFLNSTLKNKIYNCNLSDISCVRSAIQIFADKAYRRSSTAEERTRLESLYQKMKSDAATDEESLKTVFQAILISPHFLYRNVTLKDPENINIKQKLAPHELASRISYFIWGDAPDASLLQKASLNLLDDPAVLATEVDRMLRDSRAADHLSENFFKFWFGLNQFQDRTPSSALFPSFNQSIRNDMSTESQMFFREMVNGNRPFSDLLTANFSYLNQNLAQYYGLSGVTGSSFRSVDLSGTGRTGALTHGSVLTTTSHSTGTSIVRRGAFVALNLQCIEVKSPPEGVTTLLPPNGSDSIRERLEAHRSNVKCIGCHSVMDPPGFGLESFSAVGQLRISDDEGFPLDTNGVLFNGKTFSNAKELAQKLSADRTFNRCGVKKLATFALGRQLETFDDCTIERITNSVGTKTLKEIIIEIISSDPFKYERGG